MMTLDHHNLPQKEQLGVSPNIHPAEHQILVDEPKLEVAELVRSDADPTRAVEHEEMPSADCSVVCIQKIMTSERGEHLDEQPESVSPTTTISSTEDAIGSLRSVEHPDPSVKVDDHQIGPLSVLRDCKDTSSSPPTLLTLGTIRMSPIPSLRHFPIATLCDICDQVSADKELRKSGAVRMTIRDALMAHDQQVYVVIAQDPPQWINRAIMLRSEMFFREAILHLIGCWPEWRWPTPKRQMADYSDGRILRMIKEKAKKLQHMRMSVNEALCFATLTFKTVEKSTRPLTVTLFPEAFLVISWFRQWLTNSRMSIWDDERDDVNPMLVASMYRTLHSEAGFMRPEELMSDFGEAHVNFPFDPKEICEAITLFKGILASLTADIVGNKLMLHIKNHPEITYLTCAEIQDAEMPWKSEVKRAHSRKRTAESSMETSMETSMEPLPKRQRIGSEAVGDQVM